MKPFPFSIEPANDDEKFMREALKEAWKAYQADEVPIGAVLVLNGRVIARGYNQVESLKDATAHAEMLCITAGESAIENWRLLGTTLYTTIEPCCMCAGAIYLSRVSNVIWGAPDLRHGAHGSWVNLFLEHNPHPMHSVNIHGGILQDRCAMLMKQFFLEKRRETKELTDN